MSGQLWAGEIRVPVRGGYIVTPAVGMWDADPWPGRALIHRKHKE